MFASCFGRNDSESSYASDTESEKEPEDEKEKQEKKIEQAKEVFKERMKDIDKLVKTNSKLLDISSSPWATSRARALSSDLPGRSVPRALKELCLLRVFLFTPKSHGTFPSYLSFPVGYLFLWHCSFKPNSLLVYF